MDFEKRSPLFSQKKQVLALREKIVTLLTAGAPYNEVQREVGLVQMAESTFYYHASKLGPDAKNPIYRTKAGISEAGAVTIKDEPSNGGVKALEDAPTGKSEVQPKGVSPVKVIEKETKNRTKRRRKGGGISPNLSVKKEEYDTSKWSSELK